VLQTSSSFVREFKVLLYKDILGNIQVKLYNDLNYYLLTPWCRIFFQKLIVAQLVKQQPAFFM
jgi:hypothetical protein